MHTKYVSQLHNNIECLYTISCHFNFPIWCTYACMHVHTHACNFSLKHWVAGHLYIDWIHGVRSCNRYYLHFLMQACWGPNLSEAHPKSLYPHCSGVPSCKIGTWLRLGWQKGQNISPINNAQIWWGPGWTSGANTTPEALLMFLWVPSPLQEKCQHALAQASA